MLPKNDWDTEISGELGIPPFNRDDFVTPGDNEKRKKAIDMLKGLAGDAYDWAKKIPGMIEGEIDKFTTNANRLIDEFRNRYDSIAKSVHDLGKSILSNLFGEGKQKVDGGDVLGGLGRATEKVAKSVYSAVSKAISFFTDPNKLADLFKAYKESIVQKESSKFGLTKDSILSFETVLGALIGFSVGALLTNDLRWSVLFGIIGFGLGLATKTNMWQHIFSFFSPDKQKQAKEAYQKTVDSLSSGDKKLNLDNLFSKINEMFDRLEKMFGANFTNVKENVEEIFIYMRRRGVINTKS